eukprot:scaffold19192_cov67-Phaeocystis_antarctica.AAC.3
MPQNTLSNCLGAGTQWRQPPGRAQWSQPRRSARWWHTHTVTARATARATAHATAHATAVHGAQLLEAGRQGWEHAELLPHVADSEHLVLGVLLLLSRAPYRHLLAIQAPTPRRLEGGRCEIRLVRVTQPLALRSLQLRLPPQDVLDESAALLLLGRALAVLSVELQVGQRTCCKLLHLVGTVLQQLLESSLAALLKHGVTALGILVRDVLDRRGGVQRHLLVVLRLE